MKRRAVTIMEVLFAVMITAIGVLGTLALYSVAGRQAAKATTSDAATTSAAAAVADFNTRGMNRPATWLAWNQTAGAYQPYAPTVGECICIDPRFVAVNSSNPLAAADFPFNDPVDAGAVPALPARAYMRRVTLSDNLPNPGPMGKLLADSIFTFVDDLNFDRSPDDSIVAEQVFDTSGTTNLRRQTDGRLSWLATLTPKVERYAVIPNTDYVLSVVVFSDRPANLATDEERRVTATMIGGGIMGGEVQLSYTVPTNYTPPPSPQEYAEERLHAHTGEWLLLGGHVAHVVPTYQVPGNPTRGVPIFQWYRISDLDEIEWNTATQTATRYVTLDGRDWPQDAVNTAAFIFEGAVAVSERTIQLSNP